MLLYDYARGRIQSSDDINMKDRTNYNIADLDLSGGYTSLKTRRIHFISGVHFIGMGPKSKKLPEAEVSSITTNYY